MVADCNLQVIRRKISGHHSNLALLLNNYVKSEYIVVHFSPTHIKYKNIEWGVSIEADPLKENDNIREWALYRTQTNTVSPSTISVPV